MRTHPIGIYEKALPANPLPARFDDAARLGFDLFEISIDETQERIDRLAMSRGDRQMIRRAAFDAGIDLYSICFSAQRAYAMGSSDPAIVRRSMEMMRQAIDLAVDLGVRVIQVAGYDVFYEPHTEDTGRRYNENLAVSADLAARAGVMLAVETVETYITSVRKGLEVIDPIDSPWLTLYPDTANLYMMGFDPVEELALAGRNMTALHIREAPDDEYIPYGDGVLDFDAIFAVLKKNRYAGPFVIELWNESNPDYEAVLTQGISFIEDYCSRYF